MIQHWFGGEVITILLSLYYYYYPYNIISISLLLHKTTGKHILIISLEGSKPPHYSLLFQAYYFKFEILRIS